MTLVDFLWAIPVFGLLVFIHELGHFSVAKWCDIKVQEFAIGFGPVLAGVQKGDTRYNLRLVPLGGFVKMAGDDGDQSDPRGFSSKPLLARAAVIAAGPIMNFILASLLFSTFLYFIGTQQLNTPQLGPVLPTCTTVAAGEQVPVPCPAYAAGLQEGDLILRIDGAPVAEWQDIPRLVAASNGQPITIELQRGQELKEVQVQPLLTNDNRWMVGIRNATKREPLGQALVKGPVITVRTLGEMVNGLGEMVTGKTKPQLAGPVGITTMIAEEASRGWDSLLGLTAFLSVNLGLFNLLPIPALDGSRLVFMLVELVRGRRVDPMRESMVHFVGFMLLIGLMLVITYGEVVNR